MADNSNLAILQQDDTEYNIPPEIKEVINNNDQTENNNQ